jgi:thiamine kinase-like enzyme
MISGPFDSEEQMLEAMVQKYMHNLPKYRKHEYYSRMLPLVLRDHAPVFTHGYLQRKNILVRKDGTVVMIDWEAAGWFPSFWEYAMALFSCRWNDDWHSWVVKVIDEY